jgi:hypothetical protein
MLGTGAGKGAIREIAPRVSNVRLYDRIGLQCLLTYDLFSLFLRYWSTNKRKVQVVAHGVIRRAGSLWFNFLSGSDQPAHHEMGQALTHHLGSFIPRGSRVGLMTNPFAR